MFKFSISWQFDLKDSGGSWISFQHFILMACLKLMLHRMILSRISTSPFY